METNIKFRNFRKSKNLTQIEFAAELGIAQGTVTDIERGRIGISPRVLKKINEKYGIESGYFDRDKSENFADTNQGYESGSTQGVAFKSQYKTIDTGIAANRIDVTKHSYDEVVRIIAQTGGQIALVNLSKEVTDKLNQLFEKQRLISEKALLEVQGKTASFLQLKRSLEAIKLFQNLLDNVSNSTEINDLFSIDGTARANFNQSLAETKAFLQDRFKKLQPYAPIFNELAQALITFAIKAKSIPADITGIDAREFDEYIELNT